MEKREDDVEPLSAASEDTPDIDILKENNDDDNDDGEVSNGRFRTDENGRPDYGKGKINQFFDKFKAYITKAWDNKFARDY